MLQPPRDGLHRDRADNGRRQVVPIFPSQVMHADRRRLSGAVLLRLTQAL
nr:hypothetical protein [Kibdelosporangium sp. MJ126-NF4]